jgi:hypothetical protein
VSRFHEKLKGGMITLNDKKKNDNGGMKNNIRGQASATSCSRHAVMQTGLILWSKQGFLPFITYLLE